MGPPHWADDGRCDDGRRVPPRSREATRHGWGFLAAYGLTWLVCALAWHRWNPKAASYVTLFQGVVAVPVALVLTALTPGPSRPSLAGMDDLSILLSSGQLVGLPVVVYLVVRERFALVPLAMVMLLAVHFAPYAWLYATPLYLVVGAVLSIAAVVAAASAQRGERTTMEADAVGAGRASFSTGVVMAAGAAVAWFL